MDHLSPAGRARLLAQLQLHEGTKRDAAGLHIPYRCTAGALTIGYGHNLDANPVPGIGAHSRLNDGQADRLLGIDVAAVEKALLRRLPFAGTLCEPRYAVLVNMAFNLGINGLLGFKNTLALIERGEYGAAARGMLASKWARQVKGRAVTLARQMESGEWQQI